MVGVTDDRPDPILVARERWRRGAASAQRIGYGAFAAATILFFVGLLTSFDGPIVTAIIVALVGGSVVLAAGIQAQYAIKGAQRHEEDANAQRRRR